jgi:DNA polymerase-3 subunit epsilon
MTQQPEYFKNIEFVAFDIETTGLTPVVDRIVEIGAVKFRNGEVIENLQELIDPQMPISPGAFAVNGITDDMVRDKPTIDEVLPRFLEFLGEAVPIAHHAPFDVGFLTYDISRLNLTPADNPVLDTCTIPKRLFPHAHGYSLEHLVAFLNIPAGVFHRALADAEACMGLFNRCVAEMGGPERATIKEILELNGPPLSLCSGEIVLDEPFHPLKRALEKGNELEIRYQNARGAVSTRTITPLSIGTFRGTAMIEAFCHLCNDKRNFRLDRILEIR